MHTKREPDLYPAPCILSAAGKIVLPWRHYFCLKGIDWHLLSRGHKKTPRKGRLGNGKSHGGRKKKAVPAGIFCHSCVFCSRY